MSNNSLQPPGLLAALWREEQNPPPKTGAGDSSAGCRGRQREHRPAESIESCAPCGLLDSWAEGRSRIASKPGEGDGLRVCRLCRCGIGTPEGEQLPITEGQAVDRPGGCRVEPGVGWAELDGEREQNDRPRAPGHSSAGRLGPGCRGSGGHATGEVSTAKPARASPAEETLVGIGQDFDSAGDSGPRGVQSPIW